MGALALRTGSWECAPTADEGIAKWRAGLDGLFPTLSVDATGDGFWGRLRVARNAGLQLTDIDSTAQRVVRRPGAVRTFADEYYKLSVQLSGTGILVQDGRETVLRPGDIALYDATRPYLLEFDGDYRFLVASFAHSAVPVRAGAAGSLAGLALGGDEGVAPVFSQYTRALFGDMSLLASSAGPGMSRAFFDLLGAFVSEQLDGEVRTAGDEHAILRTRAVQLIEQRFADSSLEPRTIADDLHVSVRQLHKLFEGTGESVAARIRRRRLEEAARALSDPARRETRVADIAHACGFADHAYFGRVFRRAHGASPGAWRATQL
ncbi:helix-turn-helix domain-containing protein [Microbacterium sp. G2-8]|uniref:AraC-like ligand-binding domain-containing protein n=1 Tax=Microbacterium sp. G2-8 TaxID=2842454 RepID=UPI001C8A3450|nr:helix-turn-helix domain-containing protein [Microbacterium sp. G2-8]